MHGKCDYERFDLDPDQDLDSGRRRCPFPSYLERNRENLLKKEDNERERKESNMHVASASIILFAATARATKIPTMRTFHHR